MRISTLKNLETIEDSYLLKNVKIDVICAVAMDSEIIQVALVNSLLWILSLNGKLHEFNFETNKCEIVEYSKLISRFII